MRIVHANHLIAYVETDTDADQWLCSVYNNGVCIGMTYGPLPVPSDEEIQNKAKSVAEHLPVNIWG